ncbi:MAG: agmatinase [Candidatus Thermoplasmatota archaeon]
MKNPGFFADAEAGFKKGDYILFGVPYDKTTSFRKGMDKAPEKIREMSWNFERYNPITKIDLKNLKIHDFGNLQVKNKKPVEMVEKVRFFTEKVLGQKKFPIAIGGEHSASIGILQAFPKDTAVLSLDAHLDFRDAYQNEKYSHACVARRLTESQKKENIAILGYRSAEKNEYEDALKQNIFLKSSFEIRNNGIERILKETEEKFEGKKIYLTLDVDVIDPGYAPGTGSPEPFGLTPFEVLKIIDFFSSKIVGFDIVEVSPKYDHGQTSVLAAKIIRYIIEKSEIK